MGALFKDKEHLLRMAALFAAGAVLFVVARGLLVPEGFGVYGHFRAGALQDNRERAPVFAGRAACGECHDDVIRARAGSRHARVGCEACHGALGRHAEEPEALTPVKPDGVHICLVCHLVNVAKPRAFPQVDPAEHADGEACDECHEPHHPEVGDEGGA